MREASAARPEATTRVSFLQPVVGYIRSLWKGELPLARVFWTDMVLVGSLVNIVAMIVSLLLFVAGAPVALGVIVHFAPIGYNVLLFLGVWRSAAREASAWSFPAQAAGLVWLVLAIVI